MMGHTHMLGGFTAWMGLCVATLPSNGVMAAGAAVATGTAILNDIDHEHSMARSMLGPVTMGLGWAIRRGFGGQRRITHCIIGTILVAAGVTLMARHWHWGPWVRTAIMTGWISHIALDCCTELRCPLLYPFTLKKFGMPKGLRVSTGGKRKNGKRRKGLRGKLTAEHLIVEPALAAVSLAAVYLMVIGVHP